MLPYYSLDIPEYDGTNETKDADPLTTRRPSKDMKPSNDFVNPYIKGKMSSYITSRWLTSFVPVVYIMVIIIALPMNVIVLILFLFKVKIDKPLVVYMINMALVNILFLSVLPLNIIYRFSGNNWLFGAAACRFVISVFYIYMYISILLLAAISLDKYFTVVYTLQSWCTVSNAWRVSVLIWIISIASIGPVLITEQIHYSTHLKITTCHDVLPIVSVNSVAVYYSIALCSAFFIFPFIVIIFCYIITICCLSTTDMGNRDKKSQVVILAAVTLCAFLVCFGPTNILFLVHNLHIFGKTNNFPYFLYILSTCVCSLNCCLGLLIFYFASSRCRIFMYSLLHCRKPL